MSKAMVIYLFQDNDSSLFALSTDRTGANIPLMDTSTNWLLRDSIVELKFSEGWNIDDFQSEMENLADQGFHIFSGDYVTLYPANPQ